MELSSYFTDFLNNIEPARTHKDQASLGHNALRKRLASDEDFKDCYSDSFLQGSYRRSTAIKPVKDVDIVVVTDLDSNRVTPKEAIAFLRKRLAYYYDNVKTQNRSVNVELSYITMDVAICIAPDSGDGQLLIPDRRADRWVWTNPEGHRKYTEDLNRRSSGLFVPLVKMFKWWRLKNPTIFEAPQGFILECLAGECCDPGVDSHAKSFVNLLKNIESRYSLSVANGTVPSISDPGLPSNNVAKHLAPDEFKTFMDKILAARDLAEQAFSETNKFKSSELWRRLFWQEFPLAPEESDRKATEAAAAFPNKPIKPRQAGYA